MSIYEHFRKEEQPFVDQVLEWKADVQMRYRDKLTNFLDPREQDIVAMIIGDDDEVRFSFFGGSDHSERKRAYVAPAFFTPEEAVYKLTLFSLHFPRKFASIEHRDILGALIGLGIKREKFGDILINEHHIQFVVASEIADFVEFNLGSIGRFNVRLHRIPLNEQINRIEEWDEKTCTVSSLRIDGVLAEVYHLSRSKVRPYLEKRYVKVNWKTVDQASFQLQAGDHVSVRGLGRSKIFAVDGKTKKDKWRIRIGLQK